MKEIFILRGHKVTIFDAYWVDIKEFDHYPNKEEIAEAVQDRKETNFRVDKEFVK